MLFLLDYLDWLGSTIVEVVLLVDVARTEVHRMDLVLVEAHVLVSTPQLHLIDVLLQPGPLLLLLGQQFSLSASLCSVAELRTFILVLSLVELPKILASRGPSPEH